MRGLKFLLPVALFAVVSVALFVGLSLDPRKIPSVLINKPVPEFDLPPVLGTGLGLSSKNLKEGKVSLVNVFASWCVSCRAEHPLIMELGRKGIVPVYGLDYKDKPEQAKAWLDRFGDPYVRTGADINGRVGIDFGVYGVPETFVIDKQGRIAYKHIGPIRAEDLEKTILPMVRKLQEKKG